MKLQVCRFSTENLSLQNINTFEQLQKYVNDSIQPWDDEIWDITFMNQLSKLKLKKFKHEKRQILSTLQLNTIIYYLNLESDLNPDTSAHSKLMRACFKLCSAPLDICLLQNPWRIPLKTIFKYSFQPLKFHTQSSKCCSFMLDLVPQCAYVPSYRGAPHHYTNVQKQVEEEAHNRKSKCKKIEKYLTKVIPQKHLIEKMIRTTRFQWKHRIEFCDKCVFYPHEKEMLGDLMNFDFCTVSRPDRWNPPAALENIVVNHHATEAFLE